MNGATASQQQQQASNRRWMRDLAFLLIALSSTVYVLNENVMIKNEVNSMPQFQTKMASTSTLFDTAVVDMYSKILVDSQVRTKKAPRKDFDLSKWTQQTEGGLTNKDRLLLSKLYRKANSVFEYGLGESTFIANEVGVPRYAGVDSDVAWVDQTRRNVSDHFRFYYADTGDTEAWGFPNKTDLAKNNYDYMVAPLQAELEPFDVYMVDGRYRVPCVLLSFLHAASRGAPASDTTVLLHDCYVPGFSPEEMMYNREKRKYYVLEEFLDMVDHSRMRLCVFKRKKELTDEKLLELYQEYHDIVL